MIIKNLTNGKIIASNAWLCETLKERCKGLMFKKINPEQGCVLVNPVKDIIESSIHMLGVPQELQVLWLDEDYQVVSVKKCKKAGFWNWWKTYMPSKPAKYVVEVLDAKGTIKGDKIQFIK